MKCNEQIIQLIFQRLENNSLAVLWMGGVTNKIIKWLSFPSFFLFRKLKTILTLFHLQILFDKSAADYIVAIGEIAHYFQLKPKVKLSFIDILNNLA